MRIRTMAAVMMACACGAVRGGDVAFAPEAGAELHTAALQAAIDRAAAAGGGRVVVPKGTWKTGALFFRKGTGLRLEAGAVLLGSENKKDYPIRDVRVEGLFRKGHVSLINADGVDGFTIEGPGTIDGNGVSFWSMGTPPRLVYVANAKNVAIRNVTLTTSPMWTCHFYKCRGILVEGCTIYGGPVKGNWPPHPDAIDLDGAEDVVVRNCNINVNNDAITLKGGKGPDANDPKARPDNGLCRNVLVEGCTFGPYCFGGVTLGSECFFASNVVLRNCRFENSRSALYLKMRVDTPQLYSDVVATNLSGTAQVGLLVKPYLRHAKKEWAKLTIPSVATNVVFDPGPAFKARQPEKITPGNFYQLHRKASISPEIPKLGNLSM